MEMKFLIQSNYNILTIFINDYNQINMGNNTLKNKNVKIDFMKETHLQINQTIQ